MEAASIAEIRKSLMRLEQGDLLDACLRLARFKKDNKELLTYLLYLSNNEPGYVNYLCQMIDEQFALAPNAQKKTLRKLIRNMDKCLRFSGIKETELQVRLHFCRVLKSSKIPYKQSRVMTNMFVGQLKKIFRITEKLPSEIYQEYASEIEFVSAEFRNLFPN